jgi:hypothetical protein
MGGLLLLSHILQDDSRFFIFFAITVPEKIRWITQESGPQISTAPDGTELTQ